MKDHPWLGWPGGDCPVPDGTLVDIRFRDGEEYYGLFAYNEDFPDHLNGTATYASGCFWHNDSSYADIVAYRLHGEPLVDRVIRATVEYLQERLGSPVVVDYDAIKAKLYESA